MTDQLNTHQLRQQIATTIGVDPDEIKMKDGRWLQFMEEGVIIGLHIGRWRARTKLAYEDLGLPLPEDPEEQRALDELLVLGRKNLLPIRFMRRLDALESSSRKYINEQTFKTHWGCFLTAAKFRQVIQRLEEFQSDYFTIMREMVSDWDAVKAEWVDEYRAIARKAYRTLNTLSPNLIEQSETQFVNNFVYSVRDLIPPAATVEASFTFNWEISYIPLPSILQQDADEAIARREANALERQESRELSDMRIEVARQAQLQKKEMIGGFMRDLVVQLRTMVYEATTDVLSTMQRNDRLHPRSVVQLRNLIDNVAEMNFFGDNEIDAMVQRVRDQLNTNLDDRDPLTIGRTLQAIGTVTRNALIGLGETPRSGRTVGIADVPTMSDIRTARVSLDLSVDIPELETRKVRAGVMQPDMAMV